jgi:hypothetical protein
MEINMGQRSRGRMNRIALAVVGILLVGGATGAWAATNGAAGLRQSASSITNTAANATNTPADQDPAVTATSEPTQTTSTSRPTSTPKPHASPTPTTAAGGQSVQWHTSVVSVGGNSFVVTVGGVNYTILVNGRTNWPGTVKAIGGLRPGDDAEVVATYLFGVTYLASTVDAQPAGA